MIFLLFGSRLVSGSKSDDFYEKLTAITDLYYQEDFQNGSSKVKKKICEQADRRLRKLQGKYTKKEETRKILQLLATNSEYQESYEDVRLYYEQMLHYDELIEPDTVNTECFCCAPDNRKPVRHYGENMSQKKQYWIIQTAEIWNYGKRR